MQKTMARSFGRWCTESAANDARARHEVRSIPHEHEAGRIHRESSGLEELHSYRLRHDSLSSESRSKRGALTGSGGEAGNKDAGGKLDVGDDGTDDKRFFLETGAGDDEDDDAAGDDVQGLASADMVS